ncbi:MAG: alpha/beta hydrolase [Armatimonadota bacterium]
MPEPLIISLFCISSCLLAYTIPAFALVSPAPANPLVSLAVWPSGKMPGAGAAEPEKEQPSKGDGVVRLTNVSEPNLTVYPAPAPSRPTPAVIICPGGGYGILAMNKEGSEIASWLNSLGITGIVLKYRVPNNRDGALQDVQRAVRLVRSRSKDWNVDVSRIGVMGFSAGGHLSARLSTNYDTPAYPVVDASDRLSCRPDFVVLVYPAYLNKEDKPAPELPISSKTPPTLIIHSEDDKSFVPGSKIYDVALKANHVPHEFQLFATGGHGYGLRCEKDARVWPQRCQEWLTKISVLPKPTKTE